MVIIISLLLIFLITLGVAVAETENLIALGGPALVVGVVAGAVVMYSTGAVFIVALAAAVRHEEQ